MQIHPITFLEGELNSSSSKSYSHRAIALATFAQTPSFIINPLSTGDVQVSITLAEAIGAKIKKLPSYDELITFPVKRQDQIYHIIPISNPPNSKLSIDTKNSGTSIRIFTSLVSLLGIEIEFTGIFFNKNRPMQPLLDALKQLNIQSEILSDLNGTYGLKIVSNNLSRPSGEITIPGDISSQFITGLMCLIPNLPFEDDKISIRMTTPIKSYPYLQITEEILASFKIQFEKKFENLIGSYLIPTNQKYNGMVYTIPGDFSSAAFILAAAALNPFEKKVTLRNLNMSNPQGDKALINILKEMGANIEINDEHHSISIIGGNNLKGLKIDCSQTPDLFPILTVLGVFCRGTTQIYNAEHVRIKETDRVAVMVEELTKMGAVIIERKDGVFIQGPQQLTGYEINHHNDHRVAMALTIAAIYARSNSTLNNPEIVNDSYPRFFEDLKKIGVDIDS